MSLILAAYAVAHNFFAYSAVVALVVGIAAGLMVLNIQRARDLMLATEFQNAMFAYALGINNKFCLIIRRDGTIAYLDRGMQELFPEISKLKHRTIDALLDLGQVNREEYGKIMRAIDAGVLDKVVYTMRSTDGQYHRVMLTIDPIVRPSRFLLLRGRDYVEQRTKEENAADISVPAILTSLGNRLDEGVYATGPDGQIIYANVTLEAMLGYQEGELTRAPFYLHQLLFGLEPGSQNKLELQSFQGDVEMRAKGGRAVPVHILQDVQRAGTNGQILSCTAVIRLQGDDVKKNTLS
jgi:PAS domain-containing protein